jgi:hypothetical protein
LRSARPAIAVLANGGPDAQDLDPEAAEYLRQYERTVQEQWAAATGFRVPIRFQAGAGTSGSVMLSADAVPFRRGASAPSAELGSYETNLAIAALPPSQARWDEAELARARSMAERDPILGRSKLFQPTTKPRPALPGDTQAVRRQLFDLMPDLARTYQFQFIGDAYWSSDAGLGGPIVDPAPTSLYTQLQRYGPGRQIDRRGSLVRMRSRNWFFERAQEIPLRLVRHWKAVYGEQGALPLDEYLAAATTLSEVQLEVLPRLMAEPGLPPELFAVTPARHALRLLAALSPAQRQALSQGQALPVARMSAVQQQHFLAALRDSGRERGRSPDLGRWMQGSFSLSTGVPSGRPMQVRLQLQTPSGTERTYSLTIAPLH